MGYIRSVKPINRINMLSFSKDGFYTVDYGWYQLHFFTAYDCMVHLAGEHRNSLTILN